MKLEKEIQGTSTVENSTTMAQPIAPPVILHPEEIKLEQAVSRVKPVSPGVTRFHHRIPFGDITIYANDIPDVDFKQLVAAEEELQEKAKALSNKEKSLGIEWGKLDGEQSRGESGEDELDLNSSRVLEIETRKAEIEQGIKNLRKEQERLLDASFETFCSMVDKSVVAISWKEGWTSPVYANS